LIDENNFLTVDFLIKVHTTVPKFAMIFQFYLPKNNFTANLVESSSPSTTMFYFFNFVRVEIMIKPTPPFQELRASHILLK
jgi:hypothetical protein